MLTIRRRLIGLTDDIAEMFAIGWKCLIEASWLWKLPVAFLFFNPILWFVILSLKGAIFLFELVRDSRPVQFDIGNSQCDVRTDWLVRKVSVAEAEKENSSFPDRRMIDGLPFGFRNDLWRAIVDFMRSDDELWFYESDDDSHRYGYVVVRNGVLVARMETSPTFLISGED